MQILSDSNNNTMLVMKVLSQDVMLLAFVPPLARPGVSPITLSLRNLSVGTEINPPLCLIAKKLKVQKIVNTLVKKTIEKYVRLK
ncbi:hypothetical protein B1B04_11115 [Lysinibacillus sp. KCTC 33748]|nr:hypothetical protein B1B04_11115 [Lysinibacillus sp. KCTC 33748]SKB72290.1 hypothetical protein SAMN06295926_106191 [Lysinibacillus sp. AC-3]